MFKATTISDAQLCIDTFLLINLLLFYLKTYFDSIVDLVSVSIEFFRAIYIFSDLIATLLDCIYIALSVVNSINNNLQSVRRTYNLIVNIAIIIETYTDIQQTDISLIVLLILLLNLFRKLLYEIFLCSYQTLAVAILYSL